MSPAPSLDVSKASQTNKSAYGGIIEVLNPERSYTNLYTYPNIHALGPTVSLVVEFAAPDTLDDLMC